MQIFRGTDEYKSSRIMNFYTAQLGLLTSEQNYEGPPKVPDVVGTNVVDACVLPRRFQADCRVAYVGVDQTVHDTRLLQSQKPEEQHHFQ